MITPLPVPIHSLWDEINNAVIRTNENPNLPVPKKKYIYTYIYIQYRYVAN